MRWSDDLDLGTGQVQDVAGPFAGPFVSITFTDSQSLRHEICDVISNSKQKMARHARQRGWKSVKKTLKRMTFGRTVLVVMQRGGWKSVSNSAPVGMTQSSKPIHRISDGFPRSRNSNSDNRRISEVQATCTSCFVHRLNLRRTLGSRESSGN